MPIHKNNIGMIRKRKVEKIVSKFTYFYVLKFEKKREKIFKCFLGSFLTEFSRYLHFKTMKKLFLILFPNIRSFYFRLEPYFRFIVKYDYEKCYSSKISKNKISKKIIKPPKFIYDPILDVFFHPFFQSQDNIIK